MRALEARAHESVSAATTSLQFNAKQTAFTLKVLSLFFSLFSHVFLPKRNGVDRAISGQTHPVLGGLISVFGYHDYENIYKHTMVMGQLRWQYPSNKAAIYA